LDNLTHTLTGLVFAQAGLGRTTRGGTLALALASNLPDIDIVFGLQSTAAYLEHHRNLSHSVVGAPLLALGLAALLKLCFREARFSRLLTASLVGVAGHVFMDLWTSYGTRVLAPFDRTFFTWDLVFIVDPLILLLLLGTLLATLRLPQPKRLAALGLGLVMSYVGARAVLHAQGLDEGIARVPGGGVVRAAALPLPLDPFRWRFIADTGAAYWTGEVALRGPATRVVRRHKLAETAATARAREASPVAGSFLAFSSFPWLEVAATGDGTEVIFRDLRFERPGRESFAARVLVGEDGRIRREAFRF
jgi:inner membrane protein